MFPPRLLLVAAGLLGLLSLACDRRPKLTPPSQLCTHQTPVACREPSHLEALLRRPELRIVHADDTVRGEQDAKLFTVQYRDRSGVVRVRAKWRHPAPATGTDDPRKEIIAYAFQKLFLDERDYVIPPAVGHCFALDEFRKAVDDDQKATFPRARCAFGALSYWLEGAQTLEALSSRDYDDLRTHHILDLHAGPALRQTVADVNLLAYAISHGDTHWEQFVFTGRGDNLRMYSIDHTIAFSSHRNPHLLPPDDWSKIHVPKLRRRSLERFRKLERQDLEKLAVVEQYIVVGGQLVPSQRTEPFGKPDQGIRWLGKQMQLGLTKGEIELAWRRIQALLERVDKGQVTTF